MKYFLVLLAALSATLFSASSASAASVHDDALQTTDTLSIEQKGYYGTNNPLEDVTFTYKSDYLYNDSKWVFREDYDEFEEAASDSNFTYITSQDIHYTSSSATDNYGKTVHVTYCSKDHSMALLWLESSVRAFCKDSNNTFTSRAVSIFYEGGNIKLRLGYSSSISTKQQTPPASYSFQQVFETSGSIEINYPAGYEGSLLPDGSDIDTDNDGLTLIQELQQGTSDNNTDTDGDGINDFKESKWLPDRDAIFCNTSVTPHTCAYPDPTTKDIYVEIDWMQNSSRSLEPSNTQKDLIASGLDDKGYNVHIDTGEYGGGNALPYVTDLDFEPSATETDYFDLKNGDSTSSISANFDPARKNIWRYVISGYNYDESPGSSGAAFAGSDNVFVSYGFVEDNQSQFGYTDFDTAIAGTTVHELGHSLCLSRGYSYTFQSAECQFSGIDNTGAPLTYDSVMNYRLQMVVTHLSDGDNGSGDHDDWTAIDNGGVADFSRWTMDDVSASGTTSIRPGITIKQAQEVKKKGILGKVKRGDKIYDYRLREVYNTKTGETSDLKVLR